MNKGFCERMMGTIASTLYGVGCVCLRMRYSIHFFVHDLFLKSNETRNALHILNLTKSIQGNAYSYISAIFLEHLYSFPARTEL